MDHANIAKVFDAGATDSGRPYLVMELVRGIPITEYCDQHQLSTQDRLELFIKICGRPARAPKGDHSPRPEALEHSRHRQRRRGGAEGDRFWHCQGHVVQADGQDPLHSVSCPGWHPRLSES